MVNHVTTRITLLLLTLIALPWGCSKKNHGTAAERALTERSTQPNPNPQMVANDQPVTPAVAPATEALKTELRRARTLLDAGKSGTPELQELLVKVKPQLPTVPVTTVGQTAKWTKVRLNTAGGYFDAIHFSSPLDIPADLVWCFANSESQKYSWYITPSRGKMAGFRSFHTVRHVILDGAELGSESQVIFQKLEGQILPKLDYFLRFAFENDQPFEAYVKLMLIPTGSREIGDSLGSLASELQIPVPLKFNSAATLRERVDNLWENGLMTEALAVIEKEMQSPPVPRSTLWLHAAFTHDRGLQLAEQGQRDAANPFFLRAAAAMRKLKADFGTFEPHQQDYFQRALYNESCSLAITGQPDQAMKSLNEAVLNGFHDWQIVIGDADFTALRGRPDFQKLIEELKAGRLSQ